MKAQRLLLASAFRAGLLLLLVFALRGYTARAQAGACDRYVVSDHHCSNPHNPCKTIQRTALIADLPPARAQEEFPQENAWAQVIPSVVWCGDPNSPVTIEVHILGRNDVAGVQVTNMNEQDRLTLYDDGTHGDVTPGDNVFTLANAQLYCNLPYLQTQGGVGSWWGFLRVTLKDGRETGNNYGIAAGLVDPRFRNVFQVMDFGDGLSATAYAFFIHDSRHEVLEDYPVAPIFCGKGNFAAYRKLYSVLPDIFDFALLMPGMQILHPDDLGENVPYDVLVSNAVRNIGLPIMDDTARFGSAGRLKSAIYHSFGGLDIFDHEVAHTWGAAIGSSLGLLQEGTATQGHWNALSDIGGQLGAYYFSNDGKVGHFADNGDGTWRLVPNTQVEPYAPLELYVMGLIPPEEVPPIHILESPDLGDPARITAASVRTITIEEIIAAEGGIRIPAYPDTQREFNLAFIVTQDRPYNDAAYAYFSLLSYLLMSREPPRPYSALAPFYWATGGRATLNTRLPVALPEPVGLPGTGGSVSPTAVPTLPPTPRPTQSPTPTATAPEPVATEVPAPTPLPTVIVTVTPAPSGPGVCGTFPLGLVLAPALWALSMRKKRTRRA